MAQTNYTPIQLYHSTTSNAIPSAANLLPGELALNIADGKLFYEDTGGVVQELSGGLEYVYKTANYTASDREGVLTNTSGGVFTVTLPATPAVGDQVVVADAGNSWGTNNLTVARNGSTIAGLAENLVCDISGASVQFVYSGTTWEVYAQIGGNSGTVVTISDIQTLTNKTISADNNTLSGIAASSFVLSNASGNIDGSAAQKVIPAGVVVGTTDTQTLTNKTISADDNTLSGIAASSFVLSNASGNIDGTVAQKVIPAGVVVGTTDTQTLTNKTISGASNTLTVDGTNAVGFRVIPQNSQSAAYTLVLDDSGKHILHPSADTTARTFTIPANSSVAYPIGTAITFINQNGAGVVTIAITTDTMRLSPAGTTGSRTLAANGSATAIKITATEWIISGSGLT